MYFQGDVLENITRELGSKHFLFVCWGCDRVGISDRKPRKTF